MQMFFKFQPQRNDAPLKLFKDQSALIINDMVFDFSGLLDKAVLPVEALDSSWFSGPVKRIGQKIVFELFLPHGPNAGHSRRFPRHVLVQKDGEIPLPVLRKTVP